MSKQRTNVKRCPHCDGLAVWLALSLGYGRQCPTRCPTGKAWRKMIAADARQDAAERGAP